MEIGAEEKRREGRPGGVSLARLYALLGSRPAVRPLRRSRHVHEGPLPDTPHPAVPGPGGHSVQGVGEGHDGELQYARGVGRGRQVSPSRRVPPITCESLRPGAALAPGPPLHGRAAAPGFHSRRGPQGLVAPGGGGADGEAEASSATRAPRAARGPGGDQPGATDPLGSGLFHLLALGELLFLSVATGVIPMSQGRFGGVVAGVTAAGIY